MNFIKNGLNHASYLFKKGGSFFDVPKSLVEEAFNMFIVKGVINQLACSAHLHESHASKQCEVADTLEPTVCARSPTLSSVTRRA